jgi:hypothetical protein
VAEHLPVLNVPVYDRLPGQPVCHRVEDGIATIVEYRRTNIRGFSVPIYSVFDIPETLRQLLE